MVWDNDSVFELSAGQIVADKYRIDGVMGSGGMGVVVAATHVELDQRVAIKFLRVVSPEALARFHREARLLVRLKNPHVTRVIDVGSLDDDTPYIVMEHLDGTDLSFVVANGKKLSIEETVDYVLQASEAVAEAHSLGMVHRDLKPANLFLARGAGGTTSVKVLDFGVSKILDDRSSGPHDLPRGGDLTNEGVALGSPGYMSPEQLTSARDVDERSDIFSLGALLYRLVTGRTAYKGSSPVSILASMAVDGLTPIRSIVPEVPEQFAAVVERCLAQEEDARYPTVAHLARALAPFATRRGRVSIEQILATLKVPFDDDPLDETVAQALVAPTSASFAVRPPMAPLYMVSASPAAGTPFPGPAMYPAGYREPHPTGPTSPGSMPPTFLVGAPDQRPVGRLIAIGVTLAALTIFTGLLVFRAMEPAVPRDGEDPSARGGAAAAPSVVPVLVPVPVLPVGATTPQPAETAPLAAVATSAPPIPSAPPEPPATATAAAIAAAAQTAEPKTKPAAVRPRSHGAASHATKSTGTSRPPNAADVPGGRR